MEALEKEFEELISSEEDDFVLSEDDTVEDIDVLVEDEVQFISIDDLSDEEFEALDEDEIIEYDGESVIIKISDEYANSISEDEDDEVIDERAKKWDTKDKKKHAAPKPDLPTGYKAVWNGKKWVKVKMSEDEKNKQRKQTGKKTGKRGRVVRVNQLDPTETNDGETLDERAKKYTPEQRKKAKAKAAFGEVPKGYKLVWDGSKFKKEKMSVREKLAAAIRSRLMKGKKQKGKRVRVNSFIPNLDVTYDATTDVDALIGSEDLSEEFKTKATTIFEAAVNTKISSIMEQAEVLMEDAIDEAVEVELDDTVNQVDAYLDYVVEEWMTDNSVAVENGIRHNIAENFMKQIKEVLISNYVEVPEAKVDVVDDLSEQVLELETKLGAVLSDNIEMKAVISEHKKVEAIHQLSGNLTDVEVEKFKELSESIEYNGDQEEFTTKLSTIKDSYFGKATPTVVDSNIEDDSDFITESVSDVMSSYTSALSRTVKK
tara:strand:+ start:1257 stop:2717 length:1461 start_codon:yes stop_codon:yes gene_type:complete